MVPRSMGGASFHIVDMGRCAGGSLWRCRLVDKQVPVSEDRATGFTILMDWPYFRSGAGSLSRIHSYGAQIGQGNSTQRGAEIFWTQIFTRNDFQQAKVLNLY